MIMETTEKAVLSDRKGSEAGLYARARDEVRKAKEAALTAVFKAFEVGCRELFEEHAELTSFSWNQYTPFFCDGEPCTFSVWSECPDINEECGFELEEEGTWDPQAQK